MVSAKSAPIEELELHAQAALEWQALLERLAERARSRPGAERLRALTPAGDVAEARLRTARVRQLLELGEHGVELPLGEFPDARETFGRVSIGASASSAELLDVLRVLERALGLREVAEQHAQQRPELCAVLDSEPRLARVSERLSSCIARDGSVADAASDQLVEARRRAREVREELKRRLGELTQRYADVLSGGYYTERDGRYVLPVRSDAHYRVEGIVLGSSGSGSTLFVEPREVTELGNKLRVREAAVAREEARVLAELSALVGEKVNECRAAFEACVQADVLAALAAFAVAARARPIDVGDDDRIEVVGARHPLLALSLPAVVPNDISLTGGKALVVSGPNAGGKTVALKCLGLFAWMARAGVPIPARAESHVGWFSHVLADVGDEQSLVRSLSTFSAHVENLSAILEHAGPRVLVLLDEVAAGTDPEEGAALAAAVLEELTLRGAAVAVTTHYERLKELAAQPGRLENASVGFDFASMSPTFRLTLGVPGASSALAVASRHGLPQAVLERARALLPQASLDREQIISQLSDERSRIRSEREGIEAERERQAELESELVAEREALHERAREHIEREAQKLSAEVRAARNELLQAREQLKAERLTQSELKSLEARVARVAGDVAIGGRFARPSQALTSHANQPDATQLKVGARVRVKRTGALGTVLEAPSRDEVHLRVGALRTREKLSAIELVAAKSAPTQAKSAKWRPAGQNRGLAQAQRSSDNTLDMRGVRVEDAANQLDGFLDRMIGRGEAVGFVLHGHGTGALRSKVREHLSSSSYIEHVRAAEPDEGGEAFTVFWVR
ncbi:MAG: Smr/MutS family protein [Polyangiaceae bacterium]